MNREAKNKDTRNKTVERLATFMDEKQNGFSKIPIILADRILKFCILSFLILFTGCYMGIQMCSHTYVFWSFVISFVGIYKAYRMLQIAEKQKYEVLEGTVFEMKGRYRPTRTYKIGIRLQDGNITQLLMDKGHKFRVGNKYRFYFSAEKEVLSGVKGVDGILNVDSFYGYEEMD